MLRNADILILGNGAAGASAAFAAKKENPLLSDMLPPSRTLK